MIHIQERNNHKSFHSSLGLADIDPKNINGWAEANVNGMGAIALVGKDVTGKPFKIQLIDDKYDGDLLYGTVKVYDFESKTWMEHHYTLNQKTEEVRLVEDEQKSPEVEMVEGKSE